MATNSRHLTDEEKVIEKHLDQVLLRQFHLSELARLIAKKSIGQELSRHEVERLEDLRELVDDPYEY